eukprot:Skav211176  [mRNA]  locus=scaffold884:6600:8908:- [translate_table: standard]
MGSSPLLLAIRTRILESTRYDIVDELCKGRADVNARDGSTYTSLHMAAYYGRLIEFGADLNCQAPPRPRSWLVSRDEHRDPWWAGQETALHFASGRGHLHTVHLLITFKAQLTILDGRGCAWLQVATGSVSVLHQAFLDTISPERTGLAMAEAITEQSLADRLAHILYSHRRDGDTSGHRRMCAASSAVTKMNDTIQCSGHRRGYVLLQAILRSALRPITSYLHTPIVASPVADAGNPYAPHSSLFRQACLLHPRDLRLWMQQLTDLQRLLNTLEQYVQSNEDPTAVQWVRDIAAQVEDEYLLLHFSPNDFRPPLTFQSPEVTVCAMAQSSFHEIYNEDESQLLADTLFNHLVLLGAHTAHDSPYGNLFLAGKQASSTISAITCTMGHRLAYVIMEAALTGLLRPHDPADQAARPQAASLLEVYNPCATSRAIYQAMQELTYEEQISLDHDLGCLQQLVVGLAGHFRDQRRHDLVHWLIDFQVLIETDQVIVSHNLHAPRPMWGGKEVMISA